MKRLMTLCLLAVLALSAAGIGFVVSQGRTEEVRVVARSNADGSIEFGIEHDGDRLLPTSRYLTPALKNTGDGKWLRSTPVEIEIGASQALTTNPAQTDERTGTPIEVKVSQLGSAEYRAERDRFTGRVNTYVGVAGKETSGLYGGAVAIICNGTELRWVLFRLPYISFSTNSVDVQFVVYEGAPFTVTMVTYDSNDGERNLYATVDWASSRIATLRSGTTLYARFQAYSQRFDGEFDISDLFNTPVQPNLEHCGE